MAIPKTFEWPAGMKTDEAPDHVTIEAIVTAKIKTTEKIADFAAQGALR